MLHKLNRVAIPVDQRARYLECVCEHTGVGLDYQPAAKKQAVETKTGIKLSVCLCCALLLLETGKYTLQDL